MKPRSIARVLGAIVYLLAGAACARALEIKGMVLTVSDLDRSIAFYQSALGFSKVGERAIADPDAGARMRTVTLKLGDETIDLQQFRDSAGPPIPADSRSNDLWFQHFAVVVSDMDKAYANLGRASFRAISSAPQTIPASNAAAAGIRAFKFKDPDGHPLELLYFPAGKGNPKWQRPTDRIFLGIDHSAIAVGDTARSLQFYRDLLGLRVAGASLNSGATQEQLDDVPGAVVQVTGLRADSGSGPGLEFLEYRLPADGRPAPADAGPQAIVHVHLVLEVDDLPRIADAIAGKGPLPPSPACAVSAQIVRGGGPPSGRYLVVHDPDGHAVLLVQRE